MATYTTMERNISEENSALSSPSSPEFLLPAFESTLQLSASPGFDQQCDDNAEQRQVSPERPAASRLRRFSRSQSAKRLSRSPSSPQVQLEPQITLDATDIRKFKKAEQRLTQSVHYLSKKVTAKNNGSPRNSALVVENVVAESTPDTFSTPTSPLSQPALITSPTSPNTTPSRRSRFARAFASSPAPSPNLSPSSPRTPQATPRTRNSRRWSQALHAIMSPSPSLPRASSPSLASISDIAWAEATDSSPTVSSTEISRWEMTIAVESTRSAQGQLLKIVKELVAKLDDKPLEELPDMKECVLFLAQFMYCGGRIPDVPSLHDAFTKLHGRAVKLCRTLARLRNKDFSLQVFEGEFKQPAILCHCLTTRKETETDVFGLKSPLTKNDVHLPGLLRHFVSDYVRFSALLREFHIQYRFERRAKRRERRLARIEKASTLFTSTGHSTTQVSPEQAEIATLSTQELLQYALKQALADQLYSAEDVDAFDPRLMLTLPRMSLFYGVRQSAFPTILREGESHTVPMEVFLPRVCRNLPYATLVALRRLGHDEASTLALRLAGVEELRIESINTASQALISNASADNIDNLFRTISKEADAGSSNSRDPRSNKLMSRALALHMSDMTEDFSMDDDSTISKAYIMLMGLSAS